MTQASTLPPWSATQLYAGTKAVGGFSFGGAYAATSHPFSTAGARNRLRLSGTLNVPGIVGFGVAQRRVRPERDGEDAALPKLQHLLLSPLRTLSDLRLGHAGDAAKLPGNALNSLSKASSQRPPARPFAGYRALTREARGASAVPGPSPSSCNGPETRTKASSAVRFTWAIHQRGRHPLCCWSNPRRDVAAIAQCRMSGFGVAGPDYVFALDQPFRSSVTGENRFGVRDPEATHRQLGYRCPSRAIRPTT